MEIEKAMTPILLMDLGMRYPTEKSKEKKRYGLYQCQYCGREFETIIQKIKKLGGTKSCGCLHKKHNLRTHRLYSIWGEMIRRCTNIKHKRYKDYGGRGIQVCERWLDIENFIEDMYPSWEEGLTLDRIDVNGNYEPDNCRWTTREVQARNTRELMSTNKSGYRGVCWHKRDKVWVAQIVINKSRRQLGRYNTALEAAKAYERYVRLNNLEHNFTPALTEEEIEKINKQEGN